MMTKEEVVKKCNDIYSSNEFVIAIDYKGMNAGDTSLFRGELKKECGVDFFVVKNTLNKRGAIGTPYEGKFNLSGQCGIIPCDNEATMMKVSKIVYKLCFKDEKAKFVDFYNKSEQFTKEQLKDYALLPSIDVLRVKIMYLLNSMSSRIAYIISEKVKRDSANNG